jgi:hypothetical protein
MKKYLGLAIVVALVVSVVPALAGDGESFHALSRLPAGEQAALTPLPDAQLATIEGTGGEVEVCIICLNVAEVVQTNVAVGSLFTDQDNRAYVRQEIN